MDDPEDTIRVIFQHAYRTLPKVEPHAYDFLDPSQDLGAAPDTEFPKVRSRRRRLNEALLIDLRGSQPVICLPAGIVYLQE